MDDLVSVAATLIIFAAAVVLMPLLALAMFIVGSKDDDY